MQLDNKRGNYKLLEANLADVLLRAAGFAKTSDEAKAVFNWKRPNSKSAGDFATVLKDVSLALIVPLSRKVRLTGAFFTAVFFFPV
jgi:hypothetical protein